MTPGPSKSVPSSSMDATCSARADQTILEVAGENKIVIPTLCHLDGLTDVGACRMCLVEVKGSNKLLPACVTQNRRRAWTVTVNSERLAELPPDHPGAALRERNHVCSVCVTNGHCELQSLAQTLGVDSHRLPYRFSDR